MVYIYQMNQKSIHVRSSLKYTIKEKFSKLKFFKLPITLNLHFVAIWQKYEYFKSDKNFENCPKYAKKWPINASEELDTESAKLDTRISLNKV